VRRPRQSTSSPFPSALEQRSCPFPRIKASWMAPKGYSRATPGQTPVQRPHPVHRTSSSSTRQPSRRTAPLGQAW
jgi:hypothetical protein